MTEPPTAEEIAQYRREEVEKLERFSAIIDAGGNPGCLQIIDENGNPLPFDQVYGTDLS